MILFDGEFLDVDDIFENDEYVLTKATYKLKYFNMEVTSVGIKDENGDIVKLIEVDRKNV